MIKITKDEFNVELDPSERAEFVHRLTSMSDPEKDLLHSVLALALHTAVDLGELKQDWESLLEKLIVKGVSWNMVFKIDKE